jgi:hypothetical protein
MNKTERVTLTLPADVLAHAREQSQGNLSHFVAQVLHDHFEHERLQRLHDALVAGAIAHAEEDLQIAQAFQYAEDEAVALHVPPYVEDEADVVTASATAE